VRGASALGSWLDRDARDVAAIVVWEPVLDGDDTPAARKWVAAARNYWDPGRSLSAALRASGAEPACLASGDTDVDVVWDAVFVYAADARWDDGLPRPIACGRTILRTLPSLSARTGH
jgi:hypothetical protein